jgi:hypothetical protein
MKYIGSVSPIFLLLALLCPIRSVMAAGTIKFLWVFDGAMHEQTSFLYRSTYGCRVRISIQAAAGS